MFNLFTPPINAFEVVLDQSGVVLKISVGGKVTIFSGHVGSTDNNVSHTTERAAAAK